jgi:hypothetical protein
LGAPAALIPAPLGVIPPMGVGTPGELGAFARPSCGRAGLPLPVGLNAIGAVAIAAAAPRFGADGTPPGGVIGSGGGGGSEMGDPTPEEKSKDGDSMAMVDSPPSSSSSSWSFGTSSSARSPPITFSSS